MFEPFRQRLAARGSRRRAGRASAVVPPAPGRERGDDGFGLRRWVAWAWAAQRGGPDPVAVALARLEFLEALNGLPASACGDLPRRLEQARTLSDLWHLRPAVHGLLARHLDQAEAGCRLAELNHHFPTSSTPRSRPGA